MDKSKQVKQEVNGTVILAPLVFPATSHCKLFLLQGLSSSYYVFARLIFRLIGGGLAPSCQILIEKYFVLTNVLAYYVKAYITRYDNRLLTNVVKQ